MVTIDTISSPTRSIRGLLGGMGAALAMLGCWYRVWATRRELAHLSDDALRDIGISREQAVEEARRLFWDSRAARREARLHMRNLR